MQNFFEAGKAHRNHRHVQAGSQHRGSCAEGGQFPRVGSFTFRKNENGIAIGHQLPGITESFTRTAFALRQRKGIKHQTCQVVVEAAGEPPEPLMPLWMEVRAEELFRHGGRQTIAPASGQRPQDRRHIEVALVIGGEDHRPFHVPQVLQPRHPDPGKKAGQEQYGRQRHTAKSARPQGTIPLRKFEISGGIGRWLHMTQIGDGSRGGESGFIHASPGSLFQFHQKLNSIE